MSSSTSSDEREYRIFQYEVMIDALTRIEARFRLLLEKEEYCKAELQYVETETQVLHEKLGMDAGAAEQAENIKLRINFLRNFMDQKCDQMQMLSLLEDVVKAQFRKALIENQEIKAEMGERVKVLEEANEQMRTKQWDLQSENNKLKGQLEKKQDEIYQTKQLVHTIRTERDEVLSHLDKIPKCAICFEKQPELLYQPCCHFVCCEPCGKGLSQCPMCRQDIWRKITVYQ